jgi:hypothetical protein
MKARALTDPPATEVGTFASTSYIKSSAGNSELQNLRKGKSLNKKKCNARGTSFLH